jgi:hypothetical protein
VIAGPRRSAPGKQRKQHSRDADNGWREVADEALSWLAQRVT